jgi:selenocysteine-specific elongation factor
VQLEYLASAGRPLKHNTSLKFFCGSAEVVARVRVLGQDTQSPGTSGWVQLELESPLPLVRGDRFIVRIPSPPATVGGGIVVDPNPGRKHRRFRPAVIERLETLAQGTPAEVLLQALQRKGPVGVRDLLDASGLGEIAPGALDELLAEGNAVVLDKENVIKGKRLVAALSWWTAITDRMQGQLASYHKRYPLRTGMGREEMRSFLRLDPRVFNGFMARAAAQELLVDEGATVRLRDHEIRFTTGQQQAINSLLGRFCRSPTTPPSFKECVAAIGEDVLTVLLNRGEVVQVSPDVVFLSSTYEEMVSRVRAHIEQEGNITLAQARDLLRTSRKYAQGLLEHLDEAGVTRRVGDERVLK